MYLNSFESYQFRNKINYNIVQKLNELSDKLKIIIVLNLSYFTCLAFALYH